MDDIERHLRYYRTMVEDTSSAIDEVYEQYLGPQRANPPRISLRAALMLYATLVQRLRETAEHLAGRRAKVSAAEDLLKAFDLRCPNIKTLRDFELHALTPQQKGFLTVMYFGDAVFSAKGLIGAQAMLRLEDHELVEALSRDLIAAIDVALEPYDTAAQTGP